MDPSSRHGVKKTINVALPNTLKRKRSSADEGKPISPIGLTREKIASQRFTHKQCAYIGDDYYSIKFNSGINLYEIAPILTQDNVLDDGIYTWVILSLNKEPPRMYFKKTLTYYEFGTKHQEILHSISCANGICNDYDLYYAGELLKDGNNIYFNLESGTYMKERLNPKKKTLGTIKASKINARDMINDRINKTGELMIEEVDKSFITHEGIPLSLNDLKIYSDLGAKIYKFNSAEKCADFNKRKNPPTLQELGGKIITKAILMSEVNGGSNQYKKKGKKDRTNKKYKKSKNKTKKVKSIKSKKNNKSRKYKK